MTEPDITDGNVPEKKTRRRGMHPAWWACVIVVLLFAAAVGTGLWYISTPQFAEKVRLKLVAVLEEATGGSVELKAFHWDVWKLTCEADDLTIHGLEAPWEVPYAHVDRLTIGLRVLTILHPSAALKFLDAQHPVFHLIVYSDGTTNQPKPKRASSNPRDTINTIFDLRAEHVAAENGVLLLNQQSLPFQLRANDVSVLVKYVAGRIGSGGNYSAELKLADVTTKYQKEPAVHSELQASLLLGRDAAKVEKLTWQTSRSNLELTGELQHYFAPEFQMQAHGNVDLRDVAYVAGVYQLTGGMAELNLAARGHGVADAVATGDLHLRDGAYKDPNFQISDAEVETTFRITATEIAAPDVTAHAAGGVLVHGAFHFTNWQNEPAAMDGKKFAPLTEPHAEFSADLRAIVVPQVLRSLLPRQYSELGFNTAVTGRAGGSWRGDSRRVEITAQVVMSPLNGPDGVPTSGEVDATYHGTNDTVDVRNVFAKTPGSTVQASGLIDVALRNNSRTNLNATVISTNLAEFDRVLATLGFAPKSPSPSKELPVQLHGQAEFRGHADGPLQLLHISGHLDATNFDTLLQTDKTQPPHRFQWDALHTNVDVSPQSIGVTNLTLVRGTTLLQATGTLTENGKGAYEFDSHSGIRGTAEIHNASLTDLEAMAGQQGLPVTGKLTFSAHVNGQLDNLQGAGHLSVIGGTIYGEPYHSLTAELTGNKTEIGVSKLVFLEDGGQISGTGGYDLQSHAIHADVTGSRFQLAHIQQLQGGSQPLDGALQFHLEGAGTLEAPSISGDAELKNVTLGKQVLGGISGTLQTQAHTLFVDATSDLLHSQIGLHGQVQMAGDYTAQAKLTLADTDAQQIFALYSPQARGGHSTLSGTMTLAGPLKTPKELDVQADMDKVELRYDTFTFANQGPVKLSVKHGAVQIDSFHMSGPETDLTAHGTAQLTGKREVNLQVNGRMNLKLAQSFSSNIVSSGQVNLQLDALGTLDRPRMHGQVTVDNGNFAYLDFPNGLSKVNGRLEFDEDRLEVRQLTATTGGGSVVMGGFLTYQKGLYVDLTAKAKDVRVRYPQGISSTADANLHLVGSTQQATLSGTVLLTRFGITGGLSLTSNGATLAAPPDPASLSSHVLLDVHLTSSPQLSFENSYATLAGLVDLRIRGSVAAPSVLGRVSITQGSANFAGTQYQLQRGEIYFSNPVRIDPVIDVDASASVRDYDISLGVHGTLEKLNTVYRSEPPLPQADIIALLALGRTQEQAQIYQQQESSVGADATTNALLGGALNATVSNRVQKFFGVGQVKIDPNFVGTLGQSTARVTVTQQLSKAVTLTYATNVNETSQQLIQAQFALTRDVSLVAVRDEAGVFSLLVKVRQRKR
jgi:translocation and assembly module TamB